METPKIRLARVEDAEILARHRCEMFIEMGTLRRDCGDAMFEASLRYFWGALPASRYVAWLSCVGDEPIAGGGMQINEILPRPGPDGGLLRMGPQGLIMNVYVEKPWRRQGVAESLMRHMIEFAKKGGIPSLVLHASESGRPLYERLGFGSTSEMRLFV